MQQAIERDDVYCHHKDRPAGVKGFHKEGFRFLVFMDRFDDIEDVVLVGGVMAISVFIIQSSKRWHDWFTEGFQLVHKGRCEHRALEPGDLLPVVLESRRHFRHGDIWPAEPFAVPVFEARQYLVVGEVLQGLTIIQQEATRKVLVVIRFGRAS